MDYNDLLEEMEKSEKQKQLFSDVSVELLFNKEFTDKVETFIEEAEKLKKVERELFSHAQECVNILIE